MTSVYRVGALAAYCASTYAAFSGQWIAGALMLHLAFLSAIRADLLEIFERPR